MPGCRFQKGKEEMIDYTALVGYILNFIFSFYGFILFSWWWYRIGKTTEVYAFITLLFFAEALFFGGSVYARFTKIVDPDDFINVVTSHAFALRSYFHTIILALIIGRMTCRAYRTIIYEKGKRKERRKDSRRDGDESRAGKTFT
jgi:hypothetical protein